MQIVPVIMAGGGGTRLWPLSRQEKPKQFHDLTGEASLMNLTIERLKPLNFEECVIVTGKSYETLSQEELNVARVPGTVLSEPCPKNTAAAVLYGAVYCKQRFGNCTMLILPADHYIKDNTAFIKTLESAAEEASKGRLVTIGIKPDYPETGYGYIKSGAEQKPGVSHVDAFVEKPDMKTAQHYIASGEYSWNSGIFIWQVDAILEAFKEYLPEHLNQFAPLANESADTIAQNSGSIWEIKESIFNALESVSIDYGILEKAQTCSVVSGDFGWADLGSWKSIDTVLEADNEGNRSPIKEKALFVNSENCSVFPEKSRISVLGLENIVVVESNGEILVMDKDSSQDVRKVVDLVDCVT